MSHKDHTRKTAPRPSGSRPEEAVQSTKKKQPESRVATWDDDFPPKKPAPSAPEAARSEVGSKAGKTGSENKTKMASQAGEPKQRIGGDTVKQPTKSTARQEFQYLIENEDIPDWFVEGDELADASPAFDFVQTVSKSSALMAAKKPTKNQAKLTPSFSPKPGLFKDMNPEEIDRQFENFANKRASEPKNDFLDDSEADEFEIPLQAHSSLNESGDAFARLADNINKIIEKESQDKKVSNKSNKAEPQKLEENPLVSDQPNLSLIPKPHDTAFMREYRAFEADLKPKLLKLVASRERHAINKESANGFTHSGVEEFLKIPYKIFSFYNRDNIFAKVWLYRDNMRHIEGPFMSYDMDLWNSEPNYFSPSLTLSVNSSPFLTVPCFVNREKEALALFADKVYPKLETGEAGETGDEVQPKLSSKPKADPSSEFKKKSDEEEPKKAANSNDSSKPLATSNPQTPRNTNSNQQRQSRGNYKEKQKQEFEYVAKQEKAVKQPPPPTPEPEPQDFTADLKKMLGLF